MPPDYYRKQLACKVLYDPTVLADWDGDVDPGNVDGALDQLAERVDDVELGGVDHGALSGLADDDHSQYHNDSRGDARYYTETELDGGQLDNRYFTEAEHLNASAGAGDAGKPIKLDAAGHVDASMVNDGDISHDNLADVSADDHHAQSHNIASHSDTMATGAELETLTDGSDAANIHIHDARYFTETEHLNVSAGAADAGKPVKLDAAGHIDSTMVNDADVNHTAIQNIGSNTHAQIDTHLGAANPHSGSADTDHDIDHVTGGSDKIRDATAVQDGLMTAAYGTKLDGVAAGANNYSHPNHTGEVTSSGDGATTIANNAVTNAKLADVPDWTFKGRASGAGAGDPMDLVRAEALVILGVADGADVTADNAPQAHTHDGDTLQLNGVNSDGGAFAFTTTGAVTFNQNVAAANFQVAAAGEILDANGNELFGFGQTASAVNEITITNAATGNGPIISVTGGDANVDITITPKGTGNVLLGKTLMATDTAIQFRDANQKIWSPAANHLALGANTTTYFYSAGAWEMALVANKLTFNNGATDTSLRWNASGRLDIYVGGVQEVRVSANLMEFNNGLSDTGFGWLVSGQLDFQVGGADEMTLEANRLFFTNGAINTGFGWSTSGRLSFEVGKVEQAYLESGRFEMIGATGRVAAGYFEAKGVIAAGAAGKFRFGDEVLAPSSGAPTLPLFPSGAAGVAHGWHVEFNGTTKCIVPMWTY